MVEGFFHRFFKDRVIGILRFAGVDQHNFKDHLMIQELFFQLMAVESPGLFNSPADEVAIDGLLEFSFRDTEGRFDAGFTLG